MGKSAGALEDATEALTLAPRYPEVSVGVMSISVKTCATEAKLFWENSWAPKFDDLESGWKKERPFDCKLPELKMMELAVPCEVVLITFYMLFS